ncbi:hypothetical protein MKX03_004500 [Papaver bracteatum]|nr:hypothetical protein MKX03_004500 [Papaver bracteatum]
MAAKNVKIFIWLGVIVALLLVSFEVSEVEDWMTIQVETTEKNGVKDHEYGVSLASIKCGRKKCCVK